MLSILHRDIKPDNILVMQERLREASRFRPGKASTSPWSYPGADRSGRTLPGLLYGNRGLHVPGASDQARRWTRAATSSLFGVVLV